MVQYHLFLCSSSKYNLQVKVPHATLLVQVAVAWKDQDHCLQSWRLLAAQQLPLTLIHVV